MAAEALRALAVHPDGRYLDATFGGGGHSRLLLQQLSQQGSLLALDRDPDAVRRGCDTLVDKRLRLVHRRFSEMADTAPAHSMHGVFMDLGLSSIQLDDASRGFSFHAEAPLDMRMDTSCGDTAADWLERTSDERMAEAFRELSGERHAGAIATEIVKMRQISGVPATAADLAALICRVKPARDGRKHPATRVFQALRMIVNREMEELRLGLAAAVELLCEGGHLVVISFHSLEDSAVARFMRGCVDLKPLGRAQRPSQAEVARNPRARSALLRCAEKVAATC